MVFTREAGTDCGVAWIENYRGNFICGKLDYAIEALGGVYIPPAYSPAVGAVEELRLFIARASRDF